MEAAKFEKGLLKALSKLNEDDVKRIREKIGVDSDYKIDEDGFTHYIHGGVAYV
jgi:DNA-binding transcriptional regulator YiaG